jgi:uncharacterized protein YbjT (DUF2867 family)
MATKRKVLVTGGGTFLGDNIAAALLAEGVDVTLLVRPGAEERLGPLAQRTRWFTADIWNPASLKGRGRGHASVVHTVGSMIAEPDKGLTYQMLNFISARNVANMCVSGGVQHMVLLSATRAPWVSGQYIAAKREAEQYISRVGVRPTIIRAPVAYVRGHRRSPFYQIFSLLGIVPPFSWTIFGRIAPIPVDVLARGVARITLDERATKPIYYARDLRRRNTSRELRHAIPLITNDSVRPRTPLNPYDFVDDNTPFGWTPPKE